MTNNVSTSDNFSSDQEEEEQYVNQSNISLQFSNLQSKVTVNLAEYDPEKIYLTVYPGLNMKGKCKNKDCKAYQQPTWVRKDYGQFKIGQIKYNCICPCCNTKLNFKTITTFGYRLAEVEIEGVKIIGEGDDQEAIPFKFNDTQKEGKFIKFEDNTKDIVNWGYLNINVKKLS